MEKSELVEKFSTETSWSLERARKTGKVALLKADYIRWLEAQLTWRPVSEKPEEGQFVFGYNEKTKCFDVLFFYNGGFYLRGIAVTITHWLPIPPAPEGE